MGIDVYVPCPISTCGMMSVMPPSGPMRMKALGAKPGALAPGVDAVAVVDGARCPPSTR